MIARITRQLEAALSVQSAVLSDPDLLSRVAAAAQRVAATLRAGGKVFFAGNGGSAADSQHLAAELVSRFRLERAGLPAIALTTDTSILTAVGNDYGFQRVFARQVEALGRTGDLLFAMSTSGNSPNILSALAAARAGGLFTIGLTGLGGGEMPYHCDLCLHAPSYDTPRIQEVHITLGHIICGLVEEDLFEGNREL